VRVSIDVLATRDADDSSFLIDTGATHHLVADRSLLKDLVHLEVPLRFGLANTNTKIESTEKGTLSIGLSIGQSIYVKDVYYVPAARMSISSASLCTEGWTIDLATRTISKGDVKLDLVNKGVLPYVKLARRIQNVSLVSTPLGVASAVQAESPLALEHRRLGHLGIKPLLDLAAAGELRYDNETLKSDVFTLSDCESCQRQKATRTSKGGTSPRGSEDGELVHTDTAGPFLPSPDHSYLLQLVASITSPSSPIGQPYEWRTPYTQSLKPSCTYTPSSTGSTGSYRLRSNTYVQIKEGSLQAEPPSNGTSASV